MKQSRVRLLETTPAIPRMPGWIVAPRGQTAEDAVFTAGAALAHLHGVATSAAVPHALWRARLALMAAEACAGFIGRHEGEAALRDAMHLTRAGDHPGPAGEILRHWTSAVARPVSAASLGKVLPSLAPGQVAAALDASGGTPVVRAAAALEAVLAAVPRAETAAMILADATLAKALGWDHVLPLLSLGLRGRELRLRGGDLVSACHRAVATSAGPAVALAADLARRAARLRDVTPKLRAKGASRVVDLFLASDALAPAALTHLLSDRAARRLCDRLVDLGVVRELTGRETFRLYGV